MDPIGFGGKSANLYRYGSNSPNHGTDRLGLLFVEYVSINRRFEAAVATASRCVGKLVVGEFVKGGIYVFILHGVPYVGRSVDINRRLREHSRLLGEIKHVLRIAVPEGKGRRALEQFFIEEFNAVKRGINARNEIRAARWTQVKKALCEG